MLRFIQMGQGIIGSSEVSLPEKVFLPDYTAFVFVAIALCVIILIAILIVKLQKPKDKKTVNNNTVEPVTLSPKPLPEIELANLQGIGIREEQQDAFGLSKIDMYEQAGLLAVMCDGMGGMAEGGMIARQTVSELVGMFPWADDSDLNGWISQRSGKVYRQFRGYGGTTLVAAYIKGNQLSFWSVGDSDLFLLRDDKLYSLNMRQEYKYELLTRALDGEFPVEEAFRNPQAGALSEYIGKENVNSECNRLPFILQPEDTLLLCSDGVSDTLTLKQIRSSLALPPQDCCSIMEKEIIEANKPHQDNYTAIVIKYHGKTKENLL